MPLCGSGKGKGGKGGKLSGFNVTAAAATGYDQALFDGSYCVAPNGECSTAYDQAECEACDGYTWCERTAAPSTKPTLAPTVTPTPRPTYLPTTSPTPAPSCRAPTGTDICFAIDESGSICNNRCQLSFGDKCCSNFKAATDFVEDLVDGADTRLPNARFAVAFFASSSTDEFLPDLDSLNPMASAADTKAYVDGHGYDKGWTNTGQAFKSCQELLAPSVVIGDSQKVIIMLTDGKSLCRNQILRRFSAHGRIITSTPSTLRNG